MSNKDKVTSLSFEEKLVSLESIVEKLESGQISLEDSLFEYENAVKLYADCRDFLLHTEKKVAKINESLNAEPIDFDIS